VHALVLDLRGSNSQGTAMAHAALVGDGLLDGGLMWRVRDAHDEIKEYRADRECLFRDWPLAVLVDRETAGDLLQAVVAALKDNGRAVVVGERPHGGGYTSTMVEWPEGHAVLALHTGRLLRAKEGRGWPIKPNHVVSLSDKQRNAVERWLRQKEMSDVPAGAAVQPPDDPQLAKAVDVLRAALKDAGASAKP
jgi:carboxyl-terminal processing protease